MYRDSTYYVNIKLEIDIFLGWMEYLKERKTHILRERSHSIWFLGKKKPRWKGIDMQNTSS
jgi:hypothetical protein